MLCPAIWPDGLVAARSRLVSHRLLYLIMTWVFGWLVLPGPRAQLLREREEVVIQIAAAAGR